MADKNKEELILEINKTDKTLLERVRRACNGTLNGDTILHASPSRMDDKNPHIKFIQNTIEDYNDKESLRRHDILSGVHKKLEIEWERLIRVAIAALRKADLREPFQDDSHRDKSPSAYGVTHLKEFFQKFIEFEDVLYGADRWYRDHVVHAYRVWLLGVDFLLRRYSNKQLIIDKVADNLTLDVKTDIQPNCMKASNQPNKKEQPINKHDLLNYTRNEILSIWTVSALTHDLGYPLEKAPKVLRYIQDMMSNFVSSPEMQHNLSFNSAADTINDYIVKLISTRMVQCRPHYNSTKEKIFVGRIQPKFYIKFLKSLEAPKHGIISSIVLYKSLLFFLESDCNIHEDYRFTPEEVRQFYSRREILRSIATHTCTDVYQMFVPNFSFLLFFCDELQDWGRNKYHGIKDDDIYFYPPIVKHFSARNIRVKQKYLIRHSGNDIIIKDDSPIDHAFKRIRNEFEKFRQVYRDGIDTKERRFSYSKEISITLLGDGTITITYKIPHNKKASMDIAVSNLNNLTEENVKNKWQKSKNKMNI